MTIQGGPTILVTRGFPGIIPSTSHGNVAWSDDGQCLAITKKGVLIITPYLTSSIAPPAHLIDPNLNLEHPIQTLNKAKRRAKALEEGENLSDDDAAGGEGSSGSRKPLRRPNGGEVRFYTTAIEADIMGGRESMYGWSELGDESSSALVGREASTRAAIWSPSGLNDLGGCLLVVMTSFGQVSVYAPRNDPQSKQWDEIADLTAMTRRVVEPAPSESGFSVPQMLEMRSMSMQWSPALPVSSMLGSDGSLLAVSSRSGKLALWSYGREKRFKRVAHLDVKKGWICHMAWSAWTEEEGDFCEADIAITTTDGFVSLLHVRRDLTPLDGSQWSLTLKPLRLIDRGDKRAIGAVKWVDRSFLVWTKPGSVHFWSESRGNGITWEGLRTVKLDRVGNWASANAFSPCVGIQRMNPSQLLITLSSLTQHLITDLLTSPKLSDPTGSLRHSLASRNAFLDITFDAAYVRDRYRMAPKEDRELTAVTSGWSAVGDLGDIATWVVEPLNFHNLDSVSEGHRLMTFVLADMGGMMPIGGNSVLDNLQQLLKTPPTLLHSTSIKVLMPHILRIVASHQPGSHIKDLLKLCSTETVITSDPPSEVNGNSELSGRRRKVGLLAALWGDHDLDTKRLRFVLAQWSAAAFRDAQGDFTTTMDTLTSSIKSTFTVIFVRWAASCPFSAQITSGTRDWQLLQLLIRASCENGTEAPDLTKEIISLSATYGLDETSADTAERCPACDRDLGYDASGTTKCVGGHEWSRCSITQLLITDPSYRVCYTCPAVSLLPTRHRIQPIQVTVEGEDRDWERFAPEISRDQGDWMVQNLLEAAVGCIKCGGRWMRAM